MNTTHLGIFRSSSTPAVLHGRGLSFLVMIVAAAGGGCATSQRFAVDAVRHPDAAPARTAYVLVDHTPPGAVSELAFTRVARDVRTALSSKGLFEAPAGVSPQLEVEIDFGLEGPVQKKLTHTEPVYVVAASAPRAMGSRGADDYGSTGLPQKIGDRTVTTIVLCYTKFLRLTARATRATPGDQPRPVLWSVVVTNEDESDDLTGYVRLMAAAAMDVIDDETGTERKVVLTNRDGRIAFVERGM